MNEKNEELKRTRWDFIWFGIIFWSFVLAAAGLITGSICRSLTGVMFMGIGLAYFLLRRTDLD
jgi:hypothetical protein